MSCITIWRENECLSRKEAPNDVYLVFDDDYQIGDRVVFKCESKRAIAQVDQSIRSAQVYLPSRTFTYNIPLGGDDLIAYPPGAFLKRPHLISIAADDHPYYRNLAENALDQRETILVYPHAAANVETRNEATFCARNAIDGLTSAAGHGTWPYQSWGIGARTDAYLIVDFGRRVRIDTLELYLRADFPHDAYWVQATVLLSDGAHVTFPLKGMDGAQRVVLGEHDVSWLQLKQLVKCNMESAFPALRQIKVYGIELEV